ncbi:DUF3560 domain-containing protein [Salmonella enterica subsp. enterica serovar Mikawasima]|nr:DUF3560 domain-containing protein [Salmonella enterica subsp. enterica serovar Mikawasima]
MTQLNNQGATTKPTNAPFENRAQSYRATYSPDDNKLRLYASQYLDDETYSKVHAVGFKWAPKQGLFVAPAWTPSREDLLISLAGDIEDEDSTLFERQEERAERFNDYSSKRAAESEQALAHVDALTSAIPFGQPILVGHHSERKARSHAKKIDNGMKRVVMLFERAGYWEERAEASLKHAKYKERSDVRYRRIKKIEADLRKAEKNIVASEKFLTLWRSENLDLNMARAITNHDHISCCFTLEKYPRSVEISQYEGFMSLWSALSEGIINAEQARDIAITHHEKSVKHRQRWAAHYRNRLSYERGMLKEAGSIITRANEFQIGGQVFSRGEWLTIIRVNKSNGAISSVTTPYYPSLGYKGTMKLTPDRITDYKAPSDEEASAAKKTEKRPPIVNYQEEGFKAMTKAEWAKTPSDYKGVRGVAENDEHGAYRYRRVMSSGCTLLTVYITDMKTVDIPQK